MGQPPLSRRRNRGVLDSSRLRFAILAVLIAVCAFTGTSYSATAPALVIGRPILILGIGLMAALPGGWNWRGLRTLAVLLAIFAVTMVIQLIPLPPGWWLAIPGHDRYAGIVALAPDVWRPITLVPDFTINSLLALLPTIAVLVAFAGMNERDRWATLWIVIVLCVASAAIGLIQAAGGNGPSALVVRSDEGVVTGFLANRNHGAVLLGITLPLTAVFLRRYTRTPLLRWSVLGGAAVILLPLILLSGSRQGLALGLVALLVAAAMLVQQGRGPVRQWRWMLAGGAAVVVVVAAALLSGRALSVDRLAELADTSNEARLRSLPIVLTMTRDFWLTGIGYGAFDPVYRGYEPDAFLHSTYFNHAHNDLLETMMSGGILALLPLFGLIGWLGRRGVAVLRGGRSVDPVGLGHAALAIVVLILLSSVVDYPLRTGIMSSVFAIACCWLVTLPPPPRHDHGGTLSNELSVKIRSSGRKARR